MAPNVMPGRLGSRVERPNDSASQAGRPVTLNVPCHRPRCELAATASGIDLRALGQHSNAVLDRDRINEG